MLSSVNSHNVVDTVKCSLNFTAWWTARNVLKSLSDSIHKRFPSETLTFIFVNAIICYFNFPTSFPAGYSALHSLSQAPLTNWNTAIGLQSGQTLLLKILPRTV